MRQVPRPHHNHHNHHRGGTAPDPLVWDQGGRPKARNLDIRVNVDIVSLPGPPDFLGGPWIQVPGGHILVLMLLPGRTVLVFRLGLLLFLIPCIGPLVLMTWGILVFLFWNFSSFFEQWVGHQLLSEKVTRPHVRADRPILIPSVPVSEELKFGMVVSFSEAWYVLLPSCLVVLVGFCLVGLALICPG